MSGIPASLLLLIMTSHLSNALFFHEPSYVTIQPHVVRNNSDFGFSMGYQIAKDTLVVGAPSVDKIGKVYSCDLGDAGSVTQIACNENLIDFDVLAKYSRRTHLPPDQHFYTGASIATTSDHFFTCAPLWTGPVRGSLRPDAYGTCFWHDGMEAERYEGTLEKYLKSKFTKNLKPIVGGTGWTTLADEENDLLLIVKTSLEGDFQYTSVSSPLTKTKSMILHITNTKTDQNTARYIINQWNLGFGVTAGKFFSNKTVYPFSMESKNNMAGVISYLEYNPQKKILSLLFRNPMTPYRLESKDIGTMFGTTMQAADLSMDWRDELLVGAPTQSEDDCVECGALHIYLGGDIETMDDKNRLRTILGRKIFGRFGSAIAAKDIDGDSIPELAISAPYEDSGLGAVYVLSGFEIYHTLMKFQTFKQVEVTELKLTQRIQKETFRTLGYSLQFVSDADDNGCSELAAGSPGNGSVLLFKCVPTINVTVSNQLIGEEMVREQDKNFTVAVCTTIEINELPLDIVGNISVTSSIIGEATYILKPHFHIDISCYNCSRNRQFCENVTVFIGDNEPGDYVFTSKATLHTDHIFNSKELNNTYVVASPYSQMMKTIEIPRHCKGEDCKPKLSMEIFWLGSDKYKLGSTSNETAMIQIQNDGKASYESCVWVRVIGALANIDCTKPEGLFDLTYTHKCYLRKPLKRNAKQTIKLELNMTNPTNTDRELIIEGLLFDNCNQKNASQTRIHTVPYVFTADDMYIVGISHKRKFTEKQINADNHISDNQEYQIINNGSITWKSIYAVITMEKKPFINSLEVSVTNPGKCTKENTERNITYKCTFDVMPNSIQKVITTAELLGNETINNLYDEKLNITSYIALHLEPPGEIKYATATTYMKYEKDIWFGNNKLYIILVAILVAIIIMAIVIFILYKIGFFRRKQKQRLELLRKESLKRRDSRRNTHTSAKDSQTDGLQIDGDYGDPFDDVQESTNNHTVPTEEKAHVPCS